jgi:hypothetical protein
MKTPVARSIASRFAGAEASSSDAIGSGNASPAPIWRNTRS